MRETQPDAWVKHKPWWRRVGKSKGWLWGGEKKEINKKNNKGKCVNVTISIILVPLE